MSRQKVAWLAGVALSAMTALAPVTVMAATEVQIVGAIDNGLANLAATQAPGGYWSYGGYEEAATGAAIGAFISQESHWGANAPAYQSDVNNAVSYLLANASTSTVGVRDDGNNPCGTGTCTGVYWYGAGESTYTTGIVASAIGQYAASNPSAIATTSGPLAGMTWTQIAQGITNEYAGSQTTVNNAIVSNRVGGWRYYIPGNGDSDSSTTQWAVLSMIYDQSLGATTPGFVKTGLATWLAFAQAEAGNPYGQPAGAGCYQGPPSGLCEQSDTGSVLLGLKFIGAGLSDTAVQNALAFLNAHWTEGANGTWYGNFGQPYAMWADYKALELWLGLDNTTTITNLLGCGSLDSTQVCNWWQDYNNWLVANQNADGSWNGYAYWYGPLATAWDVSILGGTVIPVATPEPAALLVLGAGLAGLGLVRRRRRTD